MRTGHQITVQAANEALADPDALLIDPDPKSTSGQRALRKRSRARRQRKSRSCSTGGVTEAFADEAELADMAWRKFSPRAHAVFALLMENPGVAMQADEIAVKIGLANDRHGLAGVVAWPSRQCAEMGRTPPFRYESPPAPGETGS